MPTEPLLPTICVSYLSLATIDILLSELYHFYMAPLAQFTLQCIFTLYTTSFFSTVTDLNENKQIGLNTYASFITGTGATIENLLLNDPNYLYAFELNEGPSEENIKIYVNADMTSRVHNPRDPVFGKAPGTCTIQ